MAFAKKADEEGYPQVARLFRAVATAEGVHAREHFTLLEKVKSTEENLKSSFEKETFVNEVTYPAFLKDAWADGTNRSSGVLPKRGTLRSATQNSTRPR